MSDFRLKISDGTTTINIWDGTDAKVREDGLSMPLPSVRSTFIDNPSFDGGRLTSYARGNRQVEISLKIWGSSLSDLQTNIRAIHRLLEDAKERTLLGFGSKVYLEYQWGASDNQSTLFDIYEGRLEVGKILNAVLKQYVITDARLTLTCKPFGRCTNVDIAQDTLENSQSVRDIEISYLSGDDTSPKVYDANWMAQTFTTVGTFTAVGAAILCRRQLTIGTITLALYATDGSGHPTGAALASGTYDASALWTAYNDYLYVAFAASVALSAATKYALVVSLSGGDASNYLVWRYDSTGAHANGNRETSADSGSSWAADANSDHLFALYGSETNANYQDVSTSESYGDVPARMYLKVAQSGATGSEKIWIAKRSGTRQSDDLWKEGAEETSFTDIVAGAHSTLNYHQPLADISNGMYGEVVCIPAGGNISANTEIARLNFDISSAPRGQFRVLARVKVQTQDVNDYDHISFGVGYSYGGKTKAPAEASSEYYQCAANNAWEILDLGLINIPPVPESDIAGNSTFQLRMFLYATDILTLSESYKWQLDYFFILPIDEGVVILDAIASTDTLAIDGITDPPNVFKISSDLITDYPDYVGLPFTLGRENTRIYVLRDDVKAVTFASDLKCQPQRLTI